MAKKSTFAQRKKSATAAEATVYLCLDMSLHRRYIEAAHQLEHIRSRRKDSTTLDDGPTDDQWRDLVEQVADLAERIEAASEPYRFRKLGRLQWRALGDEHPATEEQRKEAETNSERRLEMDYETFWPAAIAACSLDPVLTEADVVWLRDGDDEWPGLPAEKFDEMCNTVAALHVSGVDVPKEYLAIARTLRPALSGITPAPAASPSPSSADESPPKASPTG